MIFKPYTCLLFSFFCFVSFSQTRNTEKLKKIAQKTTKHFSRKQDSLKLKAAHFLLTNLSNHKTQYCEFKHSNGEVFEFNEFDYDNIDLAKKDLKCFKQTGGNYKIKTIYDIESVNANFIIETVESSFKAWNNSPFGKSYTFETFCEYILPYRNTTEPVTRNWKKKYYEAYSPQINNADDPEDPISVCTSLLNEMDYFEFQKKRITPQRALSIDQIHFRKQGTCEDLASVAVLNARSIGLAVTYDFTPYNAASSNAHYWNTIIDKDGNHIPFNGNLALPYVFDANYRRLGKVLRKTFSTSTEALAEHIKPNRILEKKLREPNVIDVTEEYVETFDINYNFGKKLLDNIAYITVFNKGKWKALWWSKTDTLGNAKFTKMGSNIVYLPAMPKKVNHNNIAKIKLSLENYPIWLNQIGQQKLLKPDFKNSFSCTISRDNEVVGPYRDFNTVEFINGQVFNLYYWSGKWILLNSKIVKNSSLYLTNLPKNTLFRITPKKPDGFERIFTINPENCTILWF